MSLGNSDCCSSVEDSHRSSEKLSFYNSYGYKILYLLRKEGSIFSSAFTFLLKRNIPPLRKPLSIIFVLVSIHVWQNKFENCTLDIFFPIFFLCPHSNFAFHSILKALITWGGNFKIVISSLMTISMVSLWRCLMWPSSIRTGHSFPRLRINVLEK